MQKLIMMMLIILTTIGNQAFGADDILTGMRYSLSSSIMKEDRVYSVYLPPSYANNEDQKFPVLYVIDGDDTRLRGISGLVESLAMGNLSNQIPEFIIIAIPNTDRTRDLTPTETDLIFKGQILDRFDASGGADKFLKFISDELIVKIDADYRTTKTKALVGMSFGGLFTGHVMLNHPNMFTHYLISDATYIWDDNYLNRTAEEKLPTFSPDNIKVFLGLANNDYLGETGQTNRKWGNEFIDRLKTHQSDDFKVESRYFENEVHGTVEFLSWYYGLKFLFPREMN